MLLNEQVYLESKPKLYFDNNIIVYIICVWATKEIA